jgi:DNA-binding SARP family transcriptional activator
MIELRILGPLVLQGCDPQSVDALVSQPKRLGLLVYLAIGPPEGFHRRDSLLALFWPESDQSHARSALRNALSFLRHRLGDNVIVTRGDEVGLDPATFWCDVTAFVASSDAGRADEALELPLEESLRMASAYPAAYLGLPERGLLKPGMRADCVHLGDDLRVRQAWLTGRPQQG